jgi:hypothetical protein
VLATPGEAVGIGLVVSSVECAIDGPVVCAPNVGLVLFFFLDVDFVHTLGTVEVSAVAEDMLLRSLTRWPRIRIEGDNMEHLRRPNVDVYPAVSN